MSYLQDRKTKKRRNTGIVFGVLFLIIFFYFRAGIFRGFSYISSTTFRPALVLGNAIGSHFGGVTSFFTTKSSLLAENDKLKSELADDDAEKANYNATVAENESLKEALGRKNANANLVLSAILAKPNQSPYDTLVIDVGSNMKGVTSGDLVFARGDVPIGRISEVDPFSSKVVLFTNPGEKTEVVAGKDVFTSVTGRGGGNFEMVVPRDFTLLKGDTVVLPGITPYVVAVVQTIVTDPRDSFTKALLTSPVNIFELKFVQVQI